MLGEDILKDMQSLDGDDDAIKQENSDLEDEMNSHEPNLSDHSELLRDERFLMHMKTVNELIDQKLHAQTLKSTETESVVIRKSNEYGALIDKEIQSIFKYVKNIYRQKFPELESIVTIPSSYCRAVRQIQKVATHQVQELKLPFLSSHQAISLKIALSTLHEQLSEPDGATLQSAVEAVIYLHQHQNVLLMYLESCMQIVAPNLCQLVGSLVASKLISTAGGLDKLAAMPACNIQVMGGQRAAQLGLSSLERNHTGIFGQMDAVKDAPKKFQIQLVRMLASNTAKCARADLLKSNTRQGQKLREEMYERFEKIQEEGGLLRIDKPLPIPDEQPKKKRGGKRHRKNKELYEMSEIHKAKNRIKFGEEAEEEIQEGEGFGLLKAGMSKLKVGIKKQKLKVSKKMTGRMEKKGGMESSVCGSARFSTMILMVIGIVWIIFGYLDEG